MFTNLKALWMLFFWASMEASLCRRDWLHHWPLVSDSTSSLSQFPWGQGGGTKSFNLVITLGSPGNPPPCLSAVQKSLKTSLWLLSLGKCQGFQGICASKWRYRPVCIFHYVIPTKEWFHIMHFKLLCSSVSTHGYTPTPKCTFYFAQHKAAKYSFYQVFCGWIAWYSHLPHTQHP